MRREWRDHSLSILSVRCCFLTPAPGESKALGRLAQDQGSKSSLSATDQETGMRELRVLLTWAFVTYKHQDRQLGGFYNKVQGTDKRVKDGQESKEKATHLKIWGRKCRYSGRVGISETGSRGRLGQCHSGKGQKDA